jgi:hypothetical protein
VAGQEFHQPLVQLTLPLRPTRLLGPEELVSGLVTVDILPPTEFGGAVLSANGNGKV